MEKHKHPGLIIKGGIWYINKQIQGRRIRESTGTTHLKEAQLILAKRIDEVRQAKVFGKRINRTFRDATNRYLSCDDFLKLRQSTQLDYIRTLEMLDKYIGLIPLEEVCMESFEHYERDCKLKGLKNRTTNKGYQMVRRVLNLASTKWTDGYGQRWLDKPPKVTLHDLRDARKPRPITWEEQEKLFAALPEHLRDILTFKVNTGLRDANVRRLQWRWEARLASGESIFVIPGDHVKNGEPRIVVLNKIASEIIDKYRDQHATHVFTYQGQPYTTPLNNTSWCKARASLGLDMVRIHDLKHTFGTRLRAAGVSFEDRQDLLGHKSERITTHYSEAKFENLIVAADKACERRHDTLTSIQKILYDEAQQGVTKWQKNGKLSK